MESLHRPSPQTRRTELQRAAGLRHGLFGLIVGEVMFVPELRRCLGHQAQRLRLGRLGVTHCPLLQCILNSSLYA